MAFSERLKTFDTNSSVSKEFRVYTVQGAALSVLTIVAITYFVFAEIGYNFQTVTTERVHVNATSPTGLDVEFDITLPQVPCSLLNIDANDPSGQTQSLHLDKRHHIWKHRLIVDEVTGRKRFIGKKTKLEQGSTLLEEAHLESELEKFVEGEDGDEAEEEEEEECGSCFGAGEEDECCQTCDDVQRAYKRKGWSLNDLSEIPQCKHIKRVVEAENEGCNVHGIIALDSGGGNFHLAPGRDIDPMADGFVNMFDLIMKTFEQWNVTHTLHKLRFGDEYPGHIHQLDEQTRYIGDSYGMYQYYFKIVPTRYIYLNGTVIETNQFSVTEHLRHVNPGGGRGLPGVFFFYEISPLHVEIVEGYRKGWIAFFTSVCAIVGGVVTTMGLLDQYLFSRKGAATGANGGLLR